MSQTTLYAGLMLIVFWVGMVGATWVDERSVDKDTAALRPALAWGTCLAVLGAIWVGFVVFVRG